MEQNLDKYNKKLNLQLPNLSVKLCTNSRSLSSKTIINNKKNIILTEVDF